jgi:ElaB/YqjD/DUF883 family membrane-anchored ribosome-binding protein
MAQDSVTARASAAAHTLADEALVRARDLRAQAQDIASRGASAVGDSAYAAQRRLGHYAGATSRYVTEQPVKSALIAAAVGAVIAGLVVLARSRRERDYY